MFELVIPGLTPEQGVAIATACATAGAWPVTYTPVRVERRSFRRLKEVPDELWFPTASGGLSILAPGAHWDAETIALEPPLLPALEHGLQIVAEHCPDGFDFRATWSGSPIERTLAVDLSALLELVRASQLNEFTRYRVSPAVTAAAAVSRETGPG